MTTRRDILIGTLAAPLASGAPTPSPTPSDGGVAASPRVGPPDLGFLRRASLFDPDRLRFQMRREGLAALVVADPANVFYLSGHWPQLDRMGWRGAGIAIFTDDAQKPLALVMHAFLYYYTHSPESDFTDRLVFPYTQPQAEPAVEGREPTPAPGRVMRVQDASLMSARDRRRAAALGRAEAISADASWALAKALKALGLTRARLGIDVPELAGTLASRGFAGEVRAAENVLRWSRLAKSEPELRLMRLAAQANVDAACAAAAAARELGSTRALRARFYAEAAARGNLGVFMVINGTSSDLIDEPIVDGMAFSIDCVSTCRFYHGDFARTVFVGEPPALVRRAARAIEQAWADIRSRLRPGVRFADIPRIGRDSLARQGVDLNVGFTPHSVGLFHTDHPQPSLLSARSPDDLVLQENTVLSVDCPVFESGLGGTLHLEDLMWIRREGAEPMHGVPAPVLLA